MTEPEYHRHEEFINRSQKLKEMQEMGLDPYPPKFTSTTVQTDSQELSARWEGKEPGHSEEAAEGKTEPRRYRRQTGAVSRDGQKCVRPPSGRNRPHPDHV